MRCVIQRVTKASVTIDHTIYSSIALGLLVLLAVEDSDDDSDMEWMAKKIVGLRIFSDVNDQMNLSIEDIEGELLIISQFTLFASTKKGKRPSFIRAGKPEYARKMYQKFITHMKNICATEIKHGVFGADMKIDLRNDGPVTIIIDSKMKE